MVNGVDCCVNAPTSNPRCGCLPVGEVIVINYFYVYLKKKGKKIVWLSKVIRYGIVVNGVDCCVNAPTSNPHCGCLPVAKVIVINYFYIY